MPKTARARAQVPATMSEKLAWMKALLRDSELTYAQKCVAHALFMFHNQNTGQCNPSQEQIGQAVGGMSRQAVCGALKALKSDGWIAQTTTRGHSWYRLELKRADVQVPAEMSGSNDNSPAESGTSCSEFMNPGVTLSGQVGSRFPDTELSSLTVHLKPSISSVPLAEATRPGTDRPKAFGQVKRKSETRPKRAELAADWQPDDQAKAVATQAGVRTAELPTVVAHFVSYNRSRGNTSPDWPAAWQSWCLGHVVRRTRDEARIAATKPKRSRFEL